MSRDGRAIYDRFARIRVVRPNPAREARQANSGCKAESGSKINCFVYCRCGRDNETFVLWMDVGSE